MTPLRGVGVLVLLGLLGACSADAPRDCTAMGGSSGVWFDVGTLEGSRTALHACARDVCVDGPTTSTFVTDDSLTEPATVPVSLRITDAAGTVLFDATGTAALERVDVNGNGCGPIVFTGAVSARGDGTLA